MKKSLHMAQKTSSAGKSLRVKSRVGPPVTEVVVVIFSGRCYGGDGGSCTRNLLLG